MKEGGWRRIHMGGGKGVGLRTVVGMRKEIIDEQKE